MLRPTPGRLLYLIVGVVIGAIALFVYVSVAGAPAFLASIMPTPRLAPQTASKTSGGFTGKTLDKVVTVNQEASKGGVQLRINTLEEYSDGFSLTYSILGGQPGEPAPVLQPERFAVTDDRGGSYQLSTLGSTATVSPGFSAGYLAFSPALNKDASMLTVSVPHLLIVSNVADTGEPRVIDGPWQVQVALR